MRTLLMTVAAAALLLTAPNSAFAAKTANDRSYEFYEDAVRLFAKKDYRAAIIQLKNSLQQDSRNLAARVLLGTTHLRLGDGQSAEKQLTLARTTGADDNLTLVPYGRSLLVQGKTKRLLNEILPANRLPEIEAEIRFMRGQAELDQRQYEKARSGFTDALAQEMDLLGTGLRVSTVDPGMVETEFSVVRFHGDQDRADRVYEGLQALSGADIAEAIVWVADRPPNVVIADMMILPVAQAGSGLLHRKG